MTSYKRLVCVLGMLLLGFTGSSIFASEGHGRAVDVIIDEILLTADVRALEDVDTWEVPAVLLEELGDSVMGLLLNSEWRHEHMDEMLGGEGSDALAAYHRNLGIQYLQSAGDLKRVSLSHQGRWASGHMMGGFRSFPYFWNQNSWVIHRNYWIWAIVIIIGVILSISVTMYLMKKKVRPINQALSILQMRYAKGEITKQEFDDMKKVLNI